MELLQVACATLHWPADPRFEGRNALVDHHPLTVDAYRSAAQLQPRPGLMFGLRPNVVADRVWQYNSAFERDEATAVVNAAIDNLCPGVNMLGHAG